MLQQTPVHRVIPYFHAFLESFPSTAACARAPQSDVVTAWRGLGYPRRARHLHQAAQMIEQVYGGEMPREIPSLLALPGVGEYTARAVASFAFGDDVGVVDTNVGRIISRAITNRRVARRELQSIADSLVPSGLSASWNQAMLDLGAQYCRATPRCESCPIASCCAWQREGGDDPAPGSAAVSTPQAPYRGSLRELRGQALKSLEGSPRTVDELIDHGLDAQRLDTALAGLESDGLIYYDEPTWRLRD